MSRTATGLIPATCLPHGAGTRRDPARSIKRLAPNTVLPKARRAVRYDTGSCDHIAASSPGDVTPSVR